MKKWLGKLKERLKRLKPWLKQHWKIVLVVLVSAAVFLWIILKKPSLAQSIVNPPADATGGASAGDPGTPAPTSVPASTSAGMVGGATGGSLFDPPAINLGRPALQTAVPRPQSFSLASVQAGGQFGPGSAAFAMAHGPITGSTLKGANPKKKAPSSPKRWMPPSSGAGIGASAGRVTAGVATHIAGVLAGAGSFAKNAKPVPVVTAAAKHTGTIAQRTYYKPPAPPPHKVSSSKPKAAPVNPAPKPPPSPHGRRLL